MEWFQAVHVLSPIFLSGGSEEVNQVLEKYEHLIEAFFGAVSLFTLLVVIILNYRANKISEISIRETRLTQELEMRPYVYFNIIIDHGGDIINFRLYNRGRGVAKNIQLKVNQNLVIDKEKNRTLKDMQVSKPISFLAPQRDFTEFADLTRTFFQQNEDVKEVTGRVDYQDTGGKNYSSPIHINLEALGKKVTLRHPTFHNLVDLVQQMEQDLSLNRYRNK